MLSILSSSLGVKLRKNRSKSVTWDCGNLIGEISGKSGYLGYLMWVRVAKRGRKRSQKEVAEKRLW